MLRRFFNSILAAFASLFSPKSRQSQPKIEIDIMKPFEDAALQRQQKNWFDVELSEVVQGTINYKI